MNKQVKKYTTLYVTIIFIGIGMLGFFHSDSSQSYSSDVAHKSILTMEKSVEKKETSQQKEETSDKVSQPQKQQSSNQQPQSQQSQQSQKKKPQVMFLLQ